uniref:Uncharacterized protein n=1 Tax=Lutzomyia longipalpis TaxID=7200 RepID=A0A1B0ET66_LUTLO
MRLHKPNSSLLVWQLTVATSNRDPQTSGSLTSRALESLQHILVHPKHFLCILGTSWCIPGTPIKAAKPIQGSPAHNLGHHHRQREIVASPGRKRKIFGPRPGGLPLITYSLSPHVKQLFPEAQEGMVSPLLLISGCFI